MQIEVSHFGCACEKPQVEVTLSQRNLLALLDKLTWPEGESERTIARDCENGIRLILKAESDEEHYQDRKPGTMHERTEAAILAAIS